MDRQSAAPGASSISDGSRNLSMGALLRWSAPPTLA
jgi:hypothetical protein